MATLGLIDACMIASIPPFSLQTYSWPGAGYGYRYPLIEHVLGRGKPKLIIDVAGLCMPWRLSLTVVNAGGRCFFPVHSTTICIIAIHSMPCSRFNLSKFSCLSAKSSFVFAIFSG